MTTSLALLAAAAQVLDAVAYAKAVPAHAVEEIGPLMALYAWAGTAGVVAVKLAMVLFVVAVAWRLRLRVVLWWALALGLVGAASGALV